MNDYLETVKPKERTTWSHDQRVSVYTLRRRGVSTANIIKRFRRSIPGLTAVKIYNVTRMMRKADSDRCIQCSQPMTPKDWMEIRNGFIYPRCRRCRKLNQLKKSELWRIRTSQGLCGYCGHHKALPNRHSCKKCLSATYRRRIKEGLCGLCGKHTINKDRSKTLCTTCLEKA